MSLFLITFEVRGANRFPLEMLSYDGSIPLGVENAERIEAALRSDRRPRTITLGKYALEPTKVAKDRWRSFGWKVARVESRFIEQEREPISG